MADGDCHDADPEVYPGASERCDSGRDENCDGHMLVCGVAGELTPSDAGGLVLGPSYDGYASAAFATGDLDNDGCAELVVGSPGIDLDGIAAYVYGGPVLGVQAEAEAYAELVEVEPFSGYELVVGDFDGSGQQGLAVGAPDGLVLIVLPPVVGSMDLAVADMVVTVSEEDYGSALGAEDLDADGIDDLIVGVDGDDAGGSGAGAVAVFRGPLGASVGADDAAAWLYGEEGGYLGDAIAAGDVDGDGLGDLVMGAKFVDVDGQSHAGAAYLVLGPHAGTHDVADAELLVTGVDASDYLGYSVLVEELDGDGLGDLVIAAPGYDVEGAVWIHLGRSDGSWDADAPEVSLLGGGVGRPGYSLAAGDFDADGQQDLLVEAYVGYCDYSVYCYDDRGYLLHGPLSGTLTLEDAAAELSDGYNAGMAMGTGDLNGDGASEAIMGWWWRSETYYGQWTASVFYGGEL